MPGVKLASADKIAHLVEYGILGFLLFGAFSSSKKTASLAAILAILCAAVAGGLDESYQGITGRSSSVYDWLADCAGATVSSCFMALYTKIRKARG